jgi:ABC-type antimicrobial peptide transport system permease subunit
VPSQEEAIPIMAEIMEKLEAFPQVQSLSQSSSPLRGFDKRAITNTANNRHYTPYSKRVGHRYFNIIEQPLIQGRNFTIADRKDTSKVVVVNQAFAKQLKADGDVLGMTLSMGTPYPFKVIGIVKNITIPGDIVVEQDSSNSGVPRIYLPNWLNGKSFILKLKPNQSISREQLVEVLAKVDTRYSVLIFNSFDNSLTQYLFPKITTAVTTAILASLVFLLAGVGLYGVMGYSTQLRRYELGTRMAIGATPKHLIKLIISDNTKAVFLGFIGSIILFTLTYIGFSEYIQPFLNWQIFPMIVASLVLITLVTLFACYWPLRQYINQPAIFSLRGGD